MKKGHNLGAGGACKKPGYELRQRASHGLSMLSEDCGCELTRHWRGRSLLMKRGREWSCLKVESRDTPGRSSGSDRQWSCLQGREAEEEEAKEEFKIIYF